MIIQLPFPHQAHALHKCRKMYLHQCWVCIALISLAFILHNQTYILSSSWREVDYLKPKRVISKCAVNWWTSKITKKLGWSMVLVLISIRSWLWVGICKLSTKANGYFRVFVSTFWQDFLQISMSFMRKINLLMYVLTNVQTAHRDINKGLHWFASLNKCKTPTKTWPKSS